MTRNQSNTAAFRLEVGECVAGCFEVQHWDATDHPWYARAIHQPTQERVQLAVQVCGPWSSPPEGPLTDLDWNMPEPHTPGMLPVVIHTEVPHGGGLLDVAVTPDLPPAFPPVEHPTSQAACNTPSANEHSEEPLFLTAPTRLLNRLSPLDRLYRFSTRVEKLHEAGLAHGALTRTSFRIDPNGHPHLRPSPGTPTPESGLGSPDRFPEREHTNISAWSRSHVSLDPDRQAQDLAALQRLANEFLTLGTDTFGIQATTCQWLPSDSQHRDLFRGLAKVVSQSGEETPQPESVLHWRKSLDQLIRVIEAAWLSDSAFQNRQVILKQLLAGDTQNFLLQGDTSPDPWCIELAAALRQRQDQTTEAYHQWQSDHRDLPLHTSTEQLLELMQRGYRLPQSPPLDAIQRRLTSSIHHLREAASAMQRRDWPHTHLALAAASSLDPANTTLAGLGAITAQLVHSRKETTHA